HMPAGKQIQFEVYNGTLYSAQQFDEAKTHYSWWLTDIPAIKNESRMAAVSDVASKVVLATVPSWEEKSRWFSAVHDTIFYDNAAIKDIVHELTDGLGSELEKVAALQHWAAQEIRYSGLSMGTGEGYTIHPGNMIFTERCGVCKDKAGMLITMMRTAGYEVYPALTMAGSRVEKIPADQFNHCVVAWRHGDGSYTMLDPTWVPYSTELFSSAEQEQNYVIGTPWGEGLMITPYSPPENHLLRVKSTADIDQDGNLRGTLKLSASNYMDQRLRRYLGTHRRDDLRAFIEGWLSAISPKVELAEFATGDALDFKKPYELSITYQIPGFALVAKGSIDFCSPAWAFVAGNNYLFTASQNVDLAEREYPLFIWFTQKLECTETIKIPRDLKLVDEAKTIDLQDKFASFSVMRAYKNGIMESKGVVMVKQRTIPAADYPGFRNVINRVADYSKERIVAKDGNSL
ncbi:MAG: transglutaminase-like domain-containing protein, partial [Candidatus Latescibacterota bacterium]